MVSLMDNKRRALEDGMPEVIWATRRELNPRQLWWDAKAHGRVNDTDEQYTRTFTVIAKLEAAEKLAEAVRILRGKLETGPTTESAIMTAWDEARKHIDSYPQGTFLREVFEGVVEELTEDIDEALALWNRVNSKGDKG